MAVYNLFINFIIILLAYYRIMCYFIIAKGNRARTEGRREGQSPPDRLPEGKKKQSNKSSDGSITIEKNNAVNIDNLILVFVSMLPALFILKGYKK